jgi:hypothetical protein
LSAGHVADDPVQLSATSQPSIAGRHSVALEAKPSAGHVADDPVQVSATSQAPAEARQTAPPLPGTFWQPTFGVQLSTVHGLVSSQLKGVPTHTPA